MEELALHGARDSDVKAMRVNKNYIGLFEFGARRAQNAVPNGLGIDDETEPHDEVEVDFN